MHSSFRQISSLPLSNPSSYLFINIKGNLCLIHMAYFKGSLNGRSFLWPPSKTLIRNYHKKLAYMNLELNLLTPHKFMLYI